MDPADGPTRNEGALRRLVDIVVSATSLLLLSPLFLIVAVAIKLDSPGAVFFSQKRVGKGRVPFSMFKFRSMVADAPRAGPRVSGSADPRITRLGRWLRATKLDEFPQLWNVLRGEMTLVGPRAEVPEIIPHYSDQELEILAYRPGLTGPGQIFFTTDQAEDLDGVADAEAHYVEHQLHPKLARDLEYLRRRGWARDLAIVARTLKLILLPARPARNR